ncbi:cytokine receptor common subunit beta [Eublepharis macularius]|uniref:Cytokine receptor common subunit beta n=1 Tax=Eublepharis macularius TaxID=481883 RepID=A0AA97L675_EUBMA|nr:cytokine receptor common subunit beta [Eublepharis macularius]
MNFCRVLLTLSFILHINEAKWSQLTETLQCINDYRSFVSCTWSEQQDAQKLIKMNLFYKTSDHANFEQMTCSQDMDSQSWKWNCYRNESYFSALISEFYTFKPERKLEVKLNVSLFDNVQPPPPKELDINLTEEGDFLLTWKAGGRTNGSHRLDETLDYEVNYKRDWEPWESSSSMFISNISHCLLHHGDLVPGSTYIARVRSKPHQGSHLSGFYSAWSSAVNWTVQEGDEAQPKNLHCLFNGLDRLNCSWEVRRELTSSVLFALFYKASLELEERQCSPVEEQELADARHVLQSCEISISNPKRLSQYLISVRPKKDEKKIAPVYNIKVDPPDQLSVSKNQLQWKRIEDNIPKIFQVLYWEAGKTHEKIQPQNISEEASFTLQSLEPGTHYKAKVRAKAGHSLLSYNGPWSKWSEEYEWDTESELPIWSFALAVPPCIILAIVGLYCSQKYLVRKKREWEKSIPCPPSNILFPDYFTKVQLTESFEDSSRQSSLEEEEFNSSSALDRQMLVLDSNSLGAESGKIKPLPAVLQNTEITGFSEDKVDQCLRQPAPSSTLAYCHNARVGLTWQVFDFIGPYLMSLLGSPVPDVQEDVAPLEMRETPVSMQYVELPHGSCYQVLPVGKDKGTIPPLCTVQFEEEEKLPLLKKQETAEGQLASDVLEKEENKGQRPQSPTSPKNLSQNGISDYFTTEDLSRNTERDSSVLLPGLALKEKMLTCATKSTSASQLSETIEGLSNPELFQKKPDTVFPLEDQAPIVSSETSHDVLGDYFMALPVTPRSMPKEVDALSKKDPGHNKNFLVFNPDGKSPIFLRQVDEYCFFPSTKRITKSQEGSIGHLLTEDSQSLTKPLREGRFVESELQTTSHICQVREGEYLNESPVSI